MAFLLVRIEAPGVSIGDMNTVLLGGDDTKPTEILNNLADLINGINSRDPSATVDLAVRATTQTITAQGGGVDATCSKL
jgi:hypothetical protein